MPRRNEADPPLLLRAALRAYPPADRRGYGDELLEAAVELSAEGSEMREAAGHLRELLGEIAPDEILGRIFSGFCIGK